MERYNRTLNEAFPTAHPSMDRFVYTIKEQAVHFAKLLRDIERGIATAPPHHQVTRFEIPAAYYSFQPPALPVAQILSQPSNHIDLLSDDEL